MTGYKKVDLEKLLIELSEVKSQKAPHVNMEPTIKSSLK